MRVAVFLVFAVVLAGPAQAEARRISGPDLLCSTGNFGHIDCIRSAHFVFDTCQALRNAARRHYIDEGFFARLIWQESRFDPNALSPANARGIAQFIDSTAKLRGLKDSYNPAESIERSAQYLSYLKQENGNLGLAAMAYNGGEGRAFGFMAGNVGLPQETRDYVQIITGLTAERWRNDPPATHDFRLSKDKPFLPACYELARKRKLTQLKPPGARYAPWGVQVGFGRTEKTAKAQYRRVTGSCRAVINRQKVELVPVRNRVSGRKGYWMARLAAQQKDKAIKLCTQLRNLNCACRVYKNP